MVQEKKGMLKVWNVLLVILSFCLAVFGTFLTRSGIVNSIHSFTQSSIGPWFLGFIVAITLGSLAVVLYRLPMLRAKTKLESAISREAAFLYNNLLLVALCLTILWGVIFPIVSEAVRGESVTVGPPYFNFFLRVFGIPLLLLMGIGPLVAWRRASISSLKRMLAWPALAALVTGGVLLLFGAGSSLPGLVTYTFSAFVLASIVIEFAKGTQARRALTGGSWWSAFSGLVARNRRRYGGYVVHAAIVLLAIGVAGSSLYQTTREGKLSPGDSLQAAGYTLMYRELTREARSNHTAVRAHVDVYRDGELVRRLQPGKNRYAAEQQVSSEMAIYTNWLRAEDVDVIADQVNADGSVYFKVLVKPLVNLIWVAGFVFFAGAVIALWPDARESRRFAERYERAVAAKA
jgi:cytochrome c-type biogenesis protein CcmF